jgi:hypothetical protein
MYSRPDVRLAAAFVAFSVLAATAGDAWSAGRDEWQLSLREGAGTVNVDGRQPWGDAAALDLEYGFLDAWAVRASLEGSVHSVTGNPQTGLPGGTIHTGAALAGLTYAVDILRLVPYIDFEIGVAEIGGAVVAKQPHMLVSELGAGGDYFITRRVTAGLSFQYLYRPLDLFENLRDFGNSPFIFSVTARLSWIF